MYELVALGFKLFSQVMLFLIVFISYRHGYSDAKKEGWLK